MSIPLIIDCDPGNGVPGANVDDSIALTYAILNPQLDVRSIWTVFGNTPSPTGYECAQSLLDQIAPRNLPLLRCGSNAPLSGGGEHWLTKQHDMANSHEAKTYWGNAAGKYSTVSPISAKTSDFIHDVHSCGSATIAAIGPLTNVARLITECTDVSHIYAMGGTLGFGDLVDTNFAVDPKAAETVLTSSIPLTLIPLDVTRTTCFSLDDWKDIQSSFTQSTSRERLELIASWLVPWLRYSAATRPVNGMWLHDLVVLASIAEPDIVSVSRRRVSIADDGKLLQDNTGTLVNMVEAVDNKRLIDLWKRTIENFVQLGI